MIEKAKSALQDIALSVGDAFRNLIEAIGLAKNVKDMHDGAVELKCHTTEAQSIAINGSSVRYQQSRQNDAAIDE